jgi:hypothetical protein
LVIVEKEGLPPQVFTDKDSARAWVEFITDIALEQYMELLEINCPNDWATIIQEKPIRKKVDWSKFGF